MSPTRIIAVLTLTLAFPVTSVWAQTLYVPGTVESISGSNVGIGTTSPAGKLHIETSANHGVVIYTPTAAAGISDFATGGIGWSFSRPDDGSFTESIYSYNSSGAAKNNLAISSRNDIVFTAGNSGPSGAPERLRISENGNVGIGTTSPVQPLEVYKAGNAIIAVHQPDTAAPGKYAQLTLTHGPTYFGTSDKSWQVVSNGLATGEADLVFQYWNGTGYAPYATTITNGGSVGIGTVSPSERLEVVGSIKTSGPTAGMSRLVLQSTAAGGQQYEWYNDFTGAGSGLLGLYNRTANNWPIIFTATGNVGVGTTSPTHKLSVNGTIRAKEVIVDTGWSDYVFAKEYRLAPLSEVAQHIEREGHLPGIPSAQEVAERGISLGDMQAKLLAKVEELTLHVIAQEKRIQKLEGENAALRVR